jgi:beta-glucosidase
MDFMARAKELVSKMTIEEKIGQMRYDAPAIPRLNIPAYNWWNECLHGVARQGCATVFPQAIGMAASFNCSLMEEVATAISDEARAKYNEFKKFGSTELYQGLTYWSPNINIFRDPRWGRGHETYGEDPLLTGKMGSAFIRGLQGNGKYRKLDATIKHYAVHSGPEYERHGFNAVVSEKDLYETYLSAFKYCIDHADPSAVMGAYNRVNGEACCGSKTLLKDILYGEFGFKGYVVSDCGAIRDINAGHKITQNEAESAALAVNNGCQLNCGDAYLSLVDAYEEDLVTEETITECVEKLFEARFRLGMFDDDCEYDNIPFDVVECDKHTELNRQMARESIVLLKNNGILPLDKNKVKTIAVIGPNADDKGVLVANYHGTPSKYSTVLKGIQDGFDGKVIFSQGCHIRHTDGNWTGYPVREAIIAAKMADVVVLCMGLNPSMEGEEGDSYNGDVAGDKKDLSLTEPQIKLYNEIIALGKPTVFVNISGSAIALCDQDEKCDAVIQLFYGGAQAGNALADVLFGKYSPSGRLPVTFYRSVDDLPPFRDYSMENRTYKFFKGNPLYAFGHGLTYADISESWISENEVIVKNNGGMDTDYSVLKFKTEPHKELLDFKKIHIKVGEEIKVTF